MGAGNRERRRHPRFTMGKDVVSISQDMLAEVLDISPYGMSGRCLTNICMPLSAIVEIDLLDCERGTSVEGLRCRMVRSSSKAIAEALASTMIMNFSLEFQNLSGQQQRKLAQFITANHPARKHASRKRKR